MPLAHQRLEIPFISGIDTKTDDKSVVPPGLLQLRNADLSETGKIKKRRGYTQLGVTSSPGTAPASIEQLDVLGDRAIVWADEGLFERYDSADAYSQKVISQQSAIASTDLKQFAGDVGTAINGAEDYASTNGFEILAYMTSATAGILLFVEQSTGTVIRRTVVTAIANDLKVIAIGNILMAVYTSGTEIRLQRFDTDVPTSAPALFTPYTDVDAVAKKFDIALSTTHVIVAYTADIAATLGIKFAQITSAGAAGSSVQYTSASLTGPGVATEALGLAVDPTDNMVAAWGDGTRLEVAGVTSGFVIDSDHVLDATAGATVENVVVVVRTSTNATVYYEETSGGAPVLQEVRSGDVLITGAAGGGALGSLFGFGLAHKPLVVTTGADTNTYVGLVRQSDTESIYLTMQTGTGGGLNSDNVIAKYAYRLAAGYRLEGHVSGFNPNGLGGFGWGLGTKYNIFIDSTNTQSFAVAMQRAYFELQKTSSEVINGMLHRAGSVSLVYGEGNDARPGDINFVFAPEITTLINGNTGALTKNATYVYRAVYEYEDEFGNIHRSAPSEPKTVVLSGTDDDVTVLVRTIVHSQSSRVKIILYRNEAGKTILHRIAAEPTPILSGVDAVGTILDVESDISISVAQILYTESGALPNGAPPPTDVLVEHKNRLWAIDKDNGTIRFSQSTLLGEGTSFPFANQVAADSPSDRPITLVSMDTVLAVFWRKRVGLIYGDGPSDAGVGGAFNTPQIIENSPVGCSNIDAIAKTPRGIIFKDEDIGFHVLPTGGGVPQFIGARVEDFNDKVIVSSDVMEDKEEVRFTATDGTILVYHYNLNQWSTSLQANLGGDLITDANVWLNTHLIGTDSADLHHERDGVFLDGTIYVQLLIETAWIKFDLFQGGARVWDVFLLGEQLDDHNFNVQMNYDYGVSPTDTFAVSDGTFPAVTDPHQLRFHMVHQTLQALKLLITDSQAASPATNAGYSLTNMRIHFGIEPKGRPNVGNSNYIPPLVLG